MHVTAARLQFTRYSKEEEDEEEKRKKKKKNRQYHTAVNSVHVVARTCQHVYVSTGCRPRLMMRCSDYKQKIRTKHISYMYRKKLFRITPPTVYLKIIEIGEADDRFWTIAIAFVKFLLLLIIIKIRYLQTNISKYFSFLPGITVHCHFSDAGTLLLLENTTVSIELPRNRVNYS